MALVAPLLALALPMPASAGDGRILRAVPSGAGRYPVVAANTGNDAALAWLERSGSGLALRTATVSASGKLRGPLTVVRSARRGGLAVIGIGIDARGRQQLLYAQNPGHEKIGLRAVARRGAGRWSRPQSLGDAATGGLITTRTEATMTTSAGGESTAVWCLGGQSDNALDRSDPGTLYAATARPGKRWSRKSGIWRGQFCSFPQLDVNARGGVLASWYAEPAEIDDAPRWVATRAAGGRWSKRRELDASSGWFAGHPAIALGDDRTLLFGAAQVPSETGPVARTGFFGRSGRLGPIATLGLAPREATFGGWVGAGPPAFATAPVGRASGSTVLFGRGAAGRADGGDDIGALWSATGTGTTRSERLIDDLAAATVFDGSVPFEGAVGADLTRDAAGRPVATWVVSAGAPCTVAFYRSLQAPDGLWSRRALVAAQRTKSSRCGGDDVRTAGNGALILGEGNAGRTDVWRAATITGAASVPVVSLRTTTWAAIRTAGAIEFDCAAPGAVQCSISLIPALQSAQAREALDAACRPSVATAQLSSGGSAVVRFPLGEGCFAGGPPPGLPVGSLDLPVLAAADAVGRTSASATPTLRISS